jgi:methyl-accepting chemotaxis protein
MINLNNFKTGKRLAFGFGMMLAMMVVGTILALYCITTINKSMDSTLEEVAKMSKIQQINSTLDTLYLEMWGLVTATNAAEKQTCKAAVDVQREAYRNGLQELKAAAKTEQGRKLLAKLEEALTGCRELNQQVTEMAMKAEGADAKALQLFEDDGGKRMREQIDPAIAEIIAWREQRIKETDTLAETVVDRAWWTLAIGLVIGAMGAVFFGAAITRSVVTPIRESVNFTERLARGDFSTDIPETLRQRGDEMGELARAFHGMTGNTRKLLQEVTGGVQTLASSATELSAVSSQTSHAVRSMSERTSTVAAAAEEASANTTSVAASMEQAATNLASVASATEEMSATIGEIASNSEKARNISDQATAQAQTISALMQQLGVAAREIGKVTETITDISSQTNLLALNATIEAARAGAAGKGFAVVANAIKELARQTATATEDIKAKISGVQNSAGSAITDIERISGVIKEVGAIVSSIAASIEEQAAVTKDVANNIAQATTGVKDSNERIAQTATVSKDIARDMTGVNTAVADIRQGGEQVAASTAELSRLAEQLKATASQFKV